MAPDFNKTLEAVHFDFCYRKTFLRHGPWCTIFQNVTHGQGWKNKGVRFYSRFGEHDRTTVFFVKVRVRSFLLMMPDITIECQIQESHIGFD